MTVEMNVGLVVRRLFRSLAHADWTPVTNGPLMKHGENAFACRSFVLAAQQLQHRKAWKLQVTKYRHCTLKPCLRYTRCFQ